MNKYSPVIGLEVHVELSTKSKMFCGCDTNYFGKEPNTHTCPVCIGLPGALPVPNKIAIDSCLKIGLALNSDIPSVSKFDRKNYFYPDLPKGYQISQYDEPFCLNGNIKLSSGKTIRIRRVHMEEDTGKLTHQAGESLIDFNRSGVPLVEIVTEPDFSSSEEVVEYLKKLRQIVRALGVSNADMEKGDMRLEPNISLREITKSKSQAPNDLPKYKVEVKNINSFKFVGKAIEFEIRRQSEILDKGETPVQETRGFVESKGETITQRTKEEASDYRYFPEPDIPPFRWTKEYVEDLRKSLPQLPEQGIEQLMNTHGITKQNAEILTKNAKLRGLFEKSLKSEDIPANEIANFIINRKISDDTTPQELVQQIKSSKPQTIDKKELESIAEKVIKENESAVNDFKNGRENAIMFLIGQVMRQLGKKVDTNQIKAILIAKLK